MSFEARCPQCVFVTSQLGEPTACLLHVSPPRSDQQAPSTTGAADYDEPYEVGRARLTVDRPGPFSLRQYTRLLLLRGRFGEPSALDRAPQGASPAGR